MPTSAREFLKAATLTKEELDRFFDPDANNWAVFDTDLGYRIRQNVIQDGVDGSYTMTRYNSTGERRMVNFADRPCRINTYGDSFTQCHQVSDGESWQEYLAAHFGEPIRNFGISGQSVYQAYRRMLSIEDTDTGAEYLVLNIYSDDHFRSIYRWQALRRVDAGRRLRDDNPNPANPWRFMHMPAPYLHLDPQTGTFEERDNPYPTAESLYRLCDPDYVYETFIDDLGVHLILARELSPDTDLTLLEAAAEALTINADFDTPESIAAAAAAILHTTALRSSMHIVDKAREYARDHDKKLMVLLSFPEADILKACSGVPRFDKPFVDYLEQNEVAFVDVLESHVDEFVLFNLSPEQYIKRYYIGHYNPRGNHFFAFAVKDTIVEWLDPKPPAYRDWALVQYLDE